MKRNLIIAFCALAGITIHAQDVMVVEMNDNTTHEFTIADVRQIYFKTSGETITSIEGTWYMKSLKGYYYYPADERYEPHNSSKNPDVEYDDNATDVVMLLTKNGENLTSQWEGEGYGSTFVFEKIGENEYLCVKREGIYDRIVLKSVSDKRLVLEWYDTYYEDTKGTRKDKEHFAMGQYTFMR